MRIPTPRFARTRGRSGWSLVPALLLLPAAVLPAASAQELDPRSLRDRAPAAGEPLVVVLCYHDVTADPAAPRDAVSPDELRRHVRTLRDEGWKFRALSEVTEALRTGSKLPAKTAVLTFDDGYRSFLTEALPILREEKIPASLAVITSFVDQPPREMAPLLTWDELRTIRDSGLVEILSHTHALHRHDVANPQGLTAPAVTTRLYRPELERYENRDEYRERLLADLLRSRSRLQEELAVDARILAWPYGEHNQAARAIAREAGFTATVGLEGARVVAEDVRAGYLSRLLVVRGEPIGDPTLTWLYPGHAPVSATEVSLDSLHDTDPERTLENIELAIQDLWARNATDVFLPVCADPTGTGFLEEAWFMNHQTRVRADLWSMTAIRMKRAGFRVWARVPALSLAWVWAQHPEWRLDSTMPAGSASRHPFRLSPDLPGVAEAGADFLNDLAVYAPIDGIVFDGDARLEAGDRLRSLPDADDATKAEILETYLERLETTVLAWRPHCEVVRPRGPSAAVALTAERGAF